MGNKNKTVSFRVNEEAFESLREIAERRDLSLSAVFRDYVDTFVAHEGRVEVVPEGEVGVKDWDGEFPPTVEVPTEFVREHERLEVENERLELEVKHLREELEEHKRYIEDLQERIEEGDDEVIFLEDLDEEPLDEEPHERFT